MADSPYSVVVTPGDAYGPASSAYGAGVSAAEATIENIFYVQASILRSATRGSCYLKAGVGVLHDQHWEFALVWR